MCFVCTTCLCSQLSSYYRVLELIQSGARPNKKRRYCCEHADLPNHILKRRGACSPGKKASVIDRVPSHAYLANLSSQDQNSLYMIIVARHRVDFDGGKIIRFRAAHQRLRVASNSFTHQKGCLPARLPRGYHIPCRTRSKSEKNS